MAFRPPSLVSFPRDWVVNQVDDHSRFISARQRAGRTAEGVVGVPWRTTMRPFAPPSELTADQRRRELAGILAAGVLRLRKRRLLAGEPAQMPRETSPESAAERLEVSGETVLSVQSG